MSAAACKVVIDWYAALGAETWGFAKLAELEGYSALAADAEALAVASEAICKAGAEMVEHATEAQVKEIVVLSYEACDWAKEMRRWSDRLMNKEKLADSTITRWVEEMRQWRDAGTTLIQRFSEEQMAMQITAG
jgi:hypothetical protein